MIDKKLLKNFDISIAIIVILLLVIGIIVISSATHVHRPLQSYATVYKQLMWFVIGTIAIGFIISLDYHTLGYLSWYMYAAGIILLVAVLFTPEINGARSWFNLKFFSFQPSELVKLILIIGFSKQVDRIQERTIQDINYFKNLFYLLGYMVLPILLIMMQPDWGTAAVYIGIMVAILFVADISYKYIIGAFVSAAAILPVLFFSPIMEDYQRKRLLTFFNPDLDPLGSGYNVIQSKIAIGSGQLFGNGLFKGAQTQLGYLPEQETDFIFSVIGEELGFIWCCIIVILFTLLFIRLIQLARSSRDRFGSYIVTGVAAMMYFHVLINIGMTIGLMPVMGIPLPFISYGGSSLLTNMMAVGLVLNVAMRRQKIAF